MRRWLQNIEKVLKQSIRAHGRRNRCRVGRYLWPRRGRRGRSVAALIRRARGGNLRFGRANSQLLIERDRRNLCHYETEVGSLTLGVTGDGIDCKLTEKGGSAAFSYLLDADDARIVSRNTLEMTVQHVN